LKAESAKSTAETATLAAESSKMATALESIKSEINPFKSELNSVCRLLALLEAHNILHVSKIRVKEEN